MKVSKAIELIQVDVDDEDVDWDSPLGEAYKLSFEALKRHQKALEGFRVLQPFLLPSETPEEDKEHE